MTARDDNDEGLSSITIRSTFDKLSKRMSLYEYVYVGAVHKSFQLDFTFSMKRHTCTSRLAQYQFDRITSCILDFYIFKNFDLLSQAPGV